MTDDARTARVVSAFEHLRPDTIEHLLALYADHAAFKDPFNDVQGREAIGRVFRHMFEALHQPRFDVCVAATQGDHAFLTWDFHFQTRRSGEAMRIHGATYLQFDAQGLVQAHRDYWDAAEELYAKLPLLGPLMRWLQGKLRTPGS
jgi:ketosteroid isomerase-like protein